MRWRSIEGNMMSVVVGQKQARSLTQHRAKCIMNATTQFLPQATNNSMINIGSKDG